MFSLMTLPYAFDVFTPVLSAKTLELHYTRHHQGYVRQLNDLVHHQQEYSGLTLKEVVEKSYHHQHNAIFNNSAQIITHDLYWKSLTPLEEQRKLKSGVLQQHLETTFGSLEKFLEQCIYKGLGQFGSGWIWLLHDKSKNLLELVTTSNAQLPWIQCPEKRPLLTLDVWEHAYYVDYYNQRKEYLEKIVHYLNWKFAEDQYLTA